MENYPWWVRDWIFVDYDVMISFCVKAAILSWLWLEALCVNVSLQATMTLAIVVCYVMLQWGCNNMAATRQMAFWNAFFWMKIFIIIIKLHWNLFLMAKPSIWFRAMACCLTATSHYLNQCCPWNMLPYGITWLQIVPFWFAFLFCCQFRWVIFEEAARTGNVQLFWKASRSQTLGAEIAEIPLFRDLGLWKTPVAYFFQTCW